MAAPNSVHLTCPSGGTWYVCLSTATKFAGCCTSNPCESAIGCPPADLRSASFNPEAYGTFPDQSCLNGLFYSCNNESGSKIPFMGCCSTNPCGGECAIPQLGQTVLSDDSLRLDAFLAAIGDQGVIRSPVPPPATVTSQQTSTTQLSSSAKVNAIQSSIRLSSSTSSSETSLETTSSLVSSAISTLTRVSSASDAGSPFSISSPGPSQGGGTAKGTIAGIVVSSAVILAGLAAILFLLLTRRRRINESLRQSKLTQEATEHSAGPWSLDRAMSQTPNAHRTSVTRVGPAVLAEIKSPGPAGNSTRHSAMSLKRQSSGGPGAQDGYYYDDQSTLFTPHAGSASHSRLSDFAAENPAGRYYSSPSPSSSSRPYSLPGHDPHARSSPIYPERTYYGNSAQSPGIGNAFALTSVPYGYPTVYQYPTIIPNIGPPQNPQNGLLVPAHRYSYDSLSNSRPVTLTGLEPVLEVDQESISASSGDAGADAAATSYPHPYPRYNPSSYGHAGADADADAEFRLNPSSSIWNHQSRYSADSLPPNPYHQSFLLASSPPPPSEPRLSTFRNSRMGEAENNPD